MDDEEDSDMLFQLVFTHAYTYIRETMARIRSKN